MQRYDRIRIHRNTAVSKIRTACAERRNSPEYAQFATINYCLRKEVPQKDHAHRSGYRAGSSSRPGSVGANLKVFAVSPVRALVSKITRVGLHDRSMDKNRTVTALKTRFPIRGGNWNNGSNCGLAALNLNNARSNRNSNIGFRPASYYARSCVIYGWSASA